MPERTYPGIFEGEVPPENRIEGVGTSVAGFVGLTERGPSEPVAVGCFEEFSERFGRLLDPARPESFSYLPHAVRGFFDNGGRRAWVRRVEIADGDAISAEPLVRGLASLEEIDEISLLVAPDEVHPALPDGGRLTEAVLRQCERRRDRFAVLSTPSGEPDPAQLTRPRSSDYGAVYTPWIRVPDGRRPDLLMPPAGHLAGVYARTDRESGVHKAPANTFVHGLTSAADPLERPVGQADLETLARRGINPLREFAAEEGVRVWGARTLSSDPEWKYVSVRRLALWMEESIEKGTQWAVFEPNDEPLWDRVRRAVGGFLYDLFRRGALQGATPDEAFFVRCDRTTMTQADIDSGRLVCLIGVAPVRPAEFVIFRIQQKTLEARGG